MCTLPNIQPRKTPDQKTFLEMEEVNKKWAKTHLKNAYPKNPDPDELQMKDEADEEWCKKWRKETEKISL